MSAGGDDKDILKQLAEESDAFFDQLLSETGIPAPAVASQPAAAPAPVQACDDPEYSSLSQQLQGLPASTSLEAPSTGPLTFDLGGDSDGADTETEDMHYAAAAVEKTRPPEVPLAPVDFSAEDLALREALQNFYLLHKPDNLPNVNAIVAKYRGRSISHLWAQLCLKYGIPAREAVELLSKSLYHTAPFEYADEEEAAMVQEALQRLQGSGEPPSRSELFQRSIQQGAEDGSDRTLRVLCFRGVPDDAGLRPQVWKVMLGYLPMARHSEWNAIQGEKRALYASYKSELLEIGESDKVEVRECGARTRGCKELLLEIRNDVERTRRDLEYFRRPATCSALLALLFVYARLNPGVRYVQGMNEVAAVLLWVMSADPECAEADAFWCFNELMVEIKEGFMQALDDTGEGVHGLVKAVNAILRAYDPELAKHLQRCELPPLAFLVRWCTVLFAQDATLPDVVRLWDSFLGDPRRFEFVIHVCLALILDRRAELLQTDKQFELAEVLQAAPRTSNHAQLLKRACALCAFERRVPTPPFPPKPASQVVEELTEWAQTAASVAQEAAAKAKEVGAEVSQHIQDNIAPVVYEKAGQASAAAALAAAERAAAVQSWLEETAPARQEVLTQAQMQLSSFWDTVRATGAAAASRGQRLAAEYQQSETGEAAAARLSDVASAASSVWARAAAAAAAFADPSQVAGAASRETEPAGGQPRGANVQAADAAAPAGAAASSGEPPPLA